ncbi:hypothetical protein SUGI_1026470 [Cryptomeria japonica]|nr:hypothetical protein SUGI_1026470 [Cryptomeria japonica]
MYVFKHFEFSMAPGGEPTEKTSKTKPASPLKSSQLSATWAEPTKFDWQFLHFHGIRDVLKSNLTGQTAVKVTKAVAAEFPLLNGLGVSMAVLQFPVGGLNPPHTHPRASELLFLVDGSLLVGVVDTTGKLFTQTLISGDLFVFPKGLLHYQLNKDADNEALAISAFGSANAGTVSVPSTLFTTGIPDDVLAKSFKTNTQTIELLKAGLKST